MTARLLMVDVSSNNGPVDVDALHRDGYRAIGVKATEGTDYVNPFYAQTVDAAHRLGMVVVHYHFPTAHEGSLVQAAHFLTIVTPHVRTRRDELALDMEPIISGQAWAAGQPRVFTNAFMHQVWDKAPRVGLLRRRVRRLVYGPPYFLRDEEVRPLHHEGLWIASYGGARPIFIPQGWRGWRIWQFTSAAQVTGVSGPVDESHIRPGVLSRMRAYPTLRFGDQGQAVRLLQHLLRAAGHIDVDVNGHFETHTRSAVMQVKRDRGWRPVNGIAGRRVWRYLLRLPKAAQ